MTKPPALEQQFEDLRDQLRAEIREARETLKDLRAEIRDARTLIPLLTEELFAAEVEKQVKALGKVTEKAMADTAAKVFAEFDKVSKTLLGKDGRQRRRGQPTLAEIASATRVMNTITGHGGTP